MAIVFQKLLINCGTKTSSGSIIPSFRKYPKTSQREKNRKERKRTKKAWHFQLWGIGILAFAIPWREINLNSWSLERLSLVIAPSIVTCLRSDPLAPCKTYRFARINQRFEGVTVTIIIILHYKHYSDLF